MVLVYGNKYTTNEEEWNGERPTNDDMYSVALDYLESIEDIWRDENRNLPYDWYGSICWEIKE